MTYSAASSQLSNAHYQSDIIVEYYKYKNNGLMGNGKRIVRQEKSHLIMNDPGFHKLFILLLRHLVLLHQDHRVDHFDFFLHPVRSQGVLAPQLGWLLAMLLGVLGLRDWGSGAQLTGSVLGLVDLLGWGLECCGDVTLSELIVLWRHRVILLRDNQSIFLGILHAIVVHNIPLIIDLRLDRTSRPLHNLALAVINHERRRWLNLLDLLDLLNHIVLTLPIPLPLHFQLLSLQFQLLLPLQLKLLLPEQFFLLLLSLHPQKLLLPLQLNLLIPQILMQLFDLPQPLLSLNSLSPRQFFHLDFLTDFCMLLSVFGAVDVHAVDLVALKGCEDIVDVLYCGGEVEVFWVLQWEAVCWVCLGFGFEDADQVVYYAQLGCLDGDCVLLGEKFREVFVCPYLRPAFSIDPHEIRPRVEIAKFLKEHPQPRHNIPQNKKSLSLANRSDIPQQIDPLSDNIEIRLSSAHASPLDPILIKLDNTEIRIEIFSPLTDLAGLALITMEDGFVALDAFSCHVVIQDDLVLLFFEFTPVVLFEGGFVPITIPHIFYFYIFISDNHSHSQRAKHGYSLDVNLSRYTNHSCSQITLFLNFLNQQTLLIVAILLRVSFFIVAQMKRERICFFPFCSFFVLIFRANSRWESQTFFICFKPNIDFIRSFFWYYWRIWAWISDAKRHWYQYYINSARNFSFFLSVSIYVKARQLFLNSGSDRFQSLTFTCHSLLNSPRKPSPQFCKSALRKFFSFFLQIRSSIEYKSIFYFNALMAYFFRICSKSFSRSLLWTFSMQSSFHYRKWPQRSFNFFLSLDWRITFRQQVLENVYVFIVMRVWTTRLCFKCWPMRSIFPENPPSFSNSLKNSTFLFSPKQNSNCYRFSFISSSLTCLANRSRYQDNSPSRTRHPTIQNLTVFIFYWVSVRRVCFRAVKYL